MFFMYSLSYDVAILWGWWILEIIKCIAGIQHTVQVKAYTIENRKTQYTI